MPCEDSGLIVGLKPGLTIACAAYTLGTRDGIAGAAYSSLGGRKGCLVGSP